MKYSQAILGKDLYSLSYADVVDFFSTEKEETLNIEFKSYSLHGKHNEKEKVIIKSVCALLNSEGGVIVWGAPTEVRDANGKTTAIGALTPFDAALDRDKLINILTSSIIPMPVGIRVQFLNNGQNNDSVIIIEVEKSIERPHQFDSKYYIRLDGQTRVAPHYLIKALILGKDFPVLRGHIKLKRVQTSTGSILLTFVSVFYNSSQFNNEINAFMSVVAFSGSIIVNGVSKGYRYDGNPISILAHGRPVRSEFIIQLGTQDLNKPLKIGLQFGGEKSPSKISDYEYNFSGQLSIGEVKDESIYLVQKSENLLPSDVANNDDDTINHLLNI